MRRLRQFLADTAGATSIEYSIIGVLVGVSIVVVVKALGGSLSTKFYNATLNALQ